MDRHLKVGNIVRAGKWEVRTEKWVENKATRRFHFPALFFFTTKLMHINLFLFLLVFVAQVAPGKPEFGVHHELRPESKKTRVRIEIERKKPGHEAENKHQLGWEMNSQMDCWLNSNFVGCACAAEEVESQLTNTHEHKGEGKPSGDIEDPSKFTVFSLLSNVNVSSVSNLNGSAFCTVCPMFYYPNWCCYSALATTQKHCAPPSKPVRL